MPSRGSKLPKHVYKQTIKGHTYYRFRKAGGGSVRLPNDPDSAEFYDAYTKLLQKPTNIGRYEHGSVAFAVNLFITEGFDGLAAGTKRDYKRYLYRLDRSVGDRSLSSIDSEYIYQIRAKMRETPVAANHTVSVIRALFAFAKKRKLVMHDPTEGIEMLEGGPGFQRWMDEDIKRFRDSAGPSMRLAMELGLYTGQRLSDVIRMAWSNYDGTRIRLRQQKTGTSLVIPVHPSLKDILDVTPRVGVMILTTKTGRAFHPRVFSRDFFEAREAAGLPRDLSFHGLRHTAASRLAELGAGAPEIQAITGHKSLKLVEHYIRQANQEVQADRAIRRLPVAAKV